MSKKIISSILILSLLSQLGCYSTREVTLKEIVSDSDIEEITVMTKDSLDVIFVKPDFSIINDTLKGQGSVISQYFQKSKPLVWNIPLKDIIRLELSEFDGIKTLIFIGATILGVVVLFCLLMLASGGIDIDLSGS